MRYQDSSRSVTASSVSVWSSCANWLTMGQLLSIPLILVGVYLLRLSRGAPVLLPPATAAAQPAPLEEAA